MATFRVGLGSFNINDGSVGIGTEGSGHGNLKVEGTLKSNSADVLGVSTFTRYSGFNADNVSVSNRDLTLSGEYSTTGDIVVEDGASLTVGLGSTACVGSVECISVKNHFSVPSGNTAQRNETSGYSEGTVRYNIDLGTMEFFNGNEWRQFRYQADVQNSPSSRGRALMFGGFDVPTSYKEIQFVNISSQGNSQYFGDLSAVTRMGNSFANETRGIHGCLYPSNTANIDYVTIASGGDAIDWGADRTSSAQQQGALATSTRGIFAGGASTNVIDYIEIQTTGNCTDFGDLTTARRNIDGFASPTRGVMSAGGEFPHSNHQTTDFITVASKGNATLIGDIIGEISGVRCFSSSVVGFFAGGYNPGASVSRIKRIVTASLGSAIDFGDLSLARRSGATGNNGTRAVYMSGTTAFPAGQVNIIDAISISTSGNVTDFGDTTFTVGQTSGCSDSHGGLGGY